MKHINISRGFGTLTKMWLLETMKKIKSNLSTSDFMKFITYIEQNSYSDHVIFDEKDKCIKVHIDYTSNCTTIYQLFFFDNMKEEFLEVDGKDDTIIIQEYSKDIF